MGVLIAALHAARERGDRAWRLYSGCWSAASRAVARRGVGDVVFFSFLEVVLKDALSSDYTRVDLEDAEAALCACA